MAAPPNTTSTRVLVADDDPVSRRLMRAFLEQGNYRPIVCENGSDAVSVLLGENPPTIAILDWMMPDITGPQVCNRVREAKLDVHPYLIVLTSKREKTELAEALEAGADDFLTKPFNPVELAARLKVAERSVGRQLALHAEIRRLRDGRKEDPLCLELIRQAVEQAADTVGLGPLTRAAGTGIADLATWTAVILPDEAIWLDLLTEVISIHGTQNQEETWQFHQAMVEAIRLEHPTMITPFPAKTTTLQPQGNVQCQAFTGRGSTIQVTSLRNDAPIQKLPVTLLRSRDVLAEAYPPPTHQEVPLLRRGAALNERVVERLFTYAQGLGEEAPRVQIIRPSAFAQSFG